ncbi:MAG: endolytic transglycosylase MltG [Dehalococcoidia bacterium]
MKANRFTYLIALNIAAAMVLAAAWIIAGSPAEIDDIGPYQSVAPGEPRIVAITVRDGQAPDSIGEALQDAGVIDSSTQFEVLVSLMGYDRLLQAGEYEFEAESSALDVVYRIRFGQVSTRSVTVIEGWRLEEIADALEAQGIPRDEFIAAVSHSNYDYDFLQDVPIDSSIEGYLYPATYAIRSDDSAESMVRKMLDAFDQNVPPAVAEQASAQGLSLNDVVTLASIIQREAVLLDEKPIMAQVFLSRLNLGIRLGADPTVQYAVAEDPGSVAEYGWWKQGLTLDDLAIDSPYNTYLVFGLPPGPISNPAADTMLAVVQPSDTNYLYFVAKGDGSHAFAETLDEHIANIEKYQSGGE